MRAIALRLLAISLLWAIAPSACARDVSGGAEETPNNDPNNDPGNNDPGNNDPNNEPGDVLAPMVGILRPAQGEEVAGAVLIAATAVDDVGVEAVEVRVDGELLARLEQAPYEVTWDAAQVAPGEHTISAVASDAAGNIDEASVSVVVGESDQPPTLAFGAPEAGALLSGSVEIEVEPLDDDGVVGVSVFIDGGLLVEDTTVPYRSRWETAEFDDGPHTIRAVATDTDGQRGEQSIEVVVDNTPPEIALTLPEGEVQDEVAASALVEDANGVREVRFEIEGQILIAQRGPFAVVMDSSGLGAGDHELRATATDAAGVSSVAAGVFRVDRAPSVAFASPLEGEVIGGPVEVVVEAVDDLGIASARLFVDGDLEGEFVDGRLLWRPAFEGGPRVLRAVVTDTAGHEVEASVEVRVDHPGRVEIARCGRACAPLVDGDVIEGLVELQAEVIDDDGEVASVVWFVDGRQIGASFEAPYPIQIDAEGIGPGDHVILARATRTDVRVAEGSVSVVVFGQLDCVSGCSHLFDCLEQICPPDFLPRELVEGQCVQSCEDQGDPAIFAQACQPLNVQICEANPILQSQCACEGGEPQPFDLGAPATVLGGATLVAEARQGADLDQDGTVDNVLGGLLTSLLGLIEEGDFNLRLAQMFRSGELLIGMSWQGLRIPIEEAPLSVDLFDLEAFDENPGGDTFFIASGQFDGRGPLSRIPGGVINGNTYAGGRARLSGSAPLSRILSGAFFGFPISIPMELDRVELQGNVDADGPEGVAILGRMTGAVSLRSLLALINAYIQSPTCSCVEVDGDLINLDDEPLPSCSAVRVDRCDESPEEARCSLLAGACQLFVPLFSDNADIDLSGDGQPDALSFTLDLDGRGARLIEAP